MMTIKHTNLLKGVVVMTEPRKPRLANRKEMLQAQPYCPERWQVISRVHQRELCSLFKCQAVYAVLSLSLLATGLILQTHLNFVQEQGLFVTSGALNGLLQAIIFLVSLVLGLSIVTSIGHEQAAGMTSHLGRSGQLQLLPESDLDRACIRPDHRAGGCFGHISGFASKPRSSRSQSFLEYHVGPTRDPGWP
jgi:hypothetical protein